MKNELWSVLGQQVRKAELALLARSHSVVAVSSAARILGVDATNAAALLAAEGWTALDSDFWAAPTNAANKKSTANSGSDAGQLGQLANYIVFLERKA